MSTMTLLDDYVDALLDGALAEGLAFDPRRPDALADACAAPARELAAVASIGAAPGRETTAEHAVAADNAVMPPSAANPMSQPALEHATQAARPAPAAPLPAFVPAFVPTVADPATPSPAVHPAAAAQPSPGVASNPSIASSHRWLRVTVGHDSYALELLRVQEVVRLAPIVALRGAARAVLGVMNLRGRIVPVVDLGLWLDAGRVDGDERSRIVVVERDDEMIGVLVSTVDDVVTLGRERIEPPLASSDPGAMVGIARVGATPTVLLDAGALFG